MSDNEMQEEFIDERTAQEESMIFDYAVEMLKHDLHIKEIKGFQSDIKADAKSNGIAVKQVTAAITQLKKEAKQDDNDARMEDFFTEKLRSNVDVSVMINELVAKDD